MDPNFKNNDGYDAVYSLPHSITTKELTLTLPSGQYEIKFNITDYGGCSISMSKSAIEEIPITLLYQLKDFLNYALPEDFRKSWFIRDKYLEVNL